LSRDILSVCGEKESGNVGAQKSSENYPSPRKNGELPGDRRGVIERSSIREKRKKGRSLRGKTGKKWK